MGCPNAMTWFGIQGTITRQNDALAAATNCIPPCPGQKTLVWTMALQTQRLIFQQDTAEFAVNTVRLAGFIPSRRQPTPGTRKLWEGYRILSLFTENYRAMRDYAGTESTVLH